MAEKGMRDNTLEVVAKEWFEARHDWLTIKAAPLSTSKEYLRYHKAENRLAEEVAKLK